jgi:hypothetical protein
MQAIALMVLNAKAEIAAPVSRPLRRWNLPTSPGAFAAQSVAAPSARNGHIS